MTPAGSVDRRQHRRRPLATAVQSYHGPSQLEFTARSVDISEGGLLIHVPARLPIKPGDVLQITLSDVPNPEFADLIGRTIDATVVRVNRQSLLSVGYVSVGLSLPAAEA